MNESGSSTWELLVQRAMNEVTLQQSLMIATVKRDSEKTIGNKGMTIKMMIGT